MALQAIVAEKKELVMALQKLLSRLPLKALGSSCAVRRVNTSGIWTPLLPSGMLPQAEDFHTLPSSPALNYSLESEIQCGAGHSFFNGTRTAPESTAEVDIPCGDFLKAEILAQAGRQIAGSLVCIAVRQGGETLAQLAGTIIHSDGIVATCVSCLCYLKSKDLKATVARFGKLDYNYPSESLAVAVGCTADRRRGFPHAEPYCCIGSIRSITNEIDARTSGPVINAELQDKGIVIGGPLVNPNFGVCGVIHYEDSFRIRATPIHDVLIYLVLSRINKYHATSFCVRFA